jgi:hypothetical protein
MNTEGVSGQTNYVMPTATPDVPSYVSNASSNNEVRPWQQLHVYPPGGDPTVGNPPAEMGYSTNTYLVHPAPFVLDAGRSMFLGGPPNVNIAPTPSAPPLHFHPQRANSYIDQAAALDFEQGTWSPYTEFCPLYVMC